MHTNNEVNIYSSKFLKIQYDKVYEMFIQEWNADEKITIKEFKSELYVYKSLFEKHRPTSTLWLQEDFTIELKQEDHDWIETNINIDCKSYGLEKCAFVVGKDVMAHLSVFNFFEETPSCIAPRHFAGKLEAMSWILNKEPYTNLSSNSDIEIKYLGKTESGKSHFSFETNTENTEATLKSFKHILKENNFLKENSSKFFSLTKREKQVFEEYAHGTAIKDIAIKLCLSELTVRTHWRNAKRKLGIKTLSDIADYRNSFFR